MNCQHCGAVLSSVTWECVRGRHCPGPRKSERTDQGDQLLIDGVSPVRQRDRAQVAVDEPLRGGNRPCDFGLFDMGSHRQSDLVDLLGKPDG